MININQLLFFIEGPIDISYSARFRRVMSLMLHVMIFHGGSW